MGWNRATQSQVLGVWVLMYVLCTGFALVWPEVNSYYFRSCLSALLLGWLAIATYRRGGVSAGSSVGREPSGRRDVIKMFLILVLVVTHIATVFLTLISGAIANFLVRKGFGFGPLILSAFVGLVFLNAMANFFYRIGQQDPDTGSPSTASTTKKG